MAHCEYCGKPITTDEFQDNDGLCVKCKPKEEKTYNHYVTFGQIHTHRVNGKTLDCDTVARFQAKNAQEGRTKAVDYFGGMFFTDYHDIQWNDEKLEYFPKGIIDID